MLIDSISLLPSLFETVVAAEAVKDELSHPEAPFQVREWIASPPPWLMFPERSADRDHALDTLGDGERESIGLADARRADLLLMDDRAAVTIARGRGLRVTGTLGVLDRAAELGLIDLADAFARLRKTSFRVRSGLFDELLVRHEHRLARPLRNRT